MSVVVDVVPTTESLDLYGEPSSRSAFSLSGHVCISISSPYSVFDRRRTARILLQSVQLTFDGQSEVITNALGYSPLRLCSITRELVTEGPLELSNEGQERGDEPAQWHVVFDLPIPGWLPASHTFAAGDLGASTQYHLQAIVKFAVLDDTASSWSLSTIYSPFRSRPRTIEVLKPVVLRRFVEPPTDEPVTEPTPMINYLLTPPPQNIPAANSVPAHVLSKIQVLGSVPKHVDVCANRLPFTLRLRTKDLPEAECQRLRVTKFTIDVVQEERCRRVKNAAEFQTKYPIAPAALQPPNTPLLNMNNVGEMYQLGLYLAPPSSAARMVASSSMLPASESGVYRLTGNTHVFAEDMSKDAATWYTLETSIPITHSLGSQTQSPDWEGAATVRPSSVSPLYDVTHALKLSVSVEYDMPDTTTDETRSADLTFSIPLTFGRIAPPLPPRDLLSGLYTMLHLPDGAFPPSAAPGLLPNGAGLPVYSQLFDAQGNRKVDDTPLPRYAPAGAEPPTDDAQPTSAISDAQTFFPHDKRQELDATSL
ncbi:hypothetical protein HMN09_00092300 [Mycena chlorophos]|uniref:Uncharacterized protein n=1 Tax=Mycena chlorophos TaxID=658473 RepID=A0A8H6TTN4_MYCCL|nr:hypothetical protein HMN09_00092300 [Mycena chlorophos]